MKNFSYLFMAGLMTLGLWSCSDDADITAGGENEISADKVYMSFKLELPTAGRSATDDGSGETNSNQTTDAEVGSTEENAVKRLDVVLATQSSTNPPTYKYVTKAQNGFENPSNDGGVYKVTFQSEDLEKVAGTKIAVFVFCNYPSSTNYQEIIDNGVSANPDLGLAWNSSTGFWMSNASITINNLATFNDLKTYNTIDNAYDLGSVSVERSVARFDYKSNNTDDLYTLETDDSSNPSIQVKLTDLALVNMSNQFHYLRRVADATSGVSNYSNPTICGKETPTNYVIDSDAAAKNSSKYLPSNFANYWSLGTDGVTNDNVANYSINFATLWPELTDALSITTINSNSEDNAEWTDEAGYHVWRYATENTLPSIASQIKSLSTGVIFRGELIDCATQPTLKRLDGTNKVYVHNNVLYGSWEKVKDIVAGITDGETDAKLLALKAAVNVTTVVAPATEPTLEEAASKGFTVYTPEGADNKYYVYYYYMNRHNDNGNSEEMGPMEFAVVRNNVYKLAVTSISQYGHPGDPAGDPDPETPTDPDEEKNVYFTVSVKVLPWVVRVNNIEF